LGNNIGLIEMYFRSIDQTQRGFLDFEQFRAIVKMIKSNSDIADVWSTLCSAVDDGAAAGISEEMFIRWMRTNQGVSHFWLRLEASIINYQVAIYLIVTSF
jgi:Ca2+-binding EF-hand superfamily protein